MSRASDHDPFAALGLPAQAGLTDDDVRAAWRRLAAATHPDRADGGDPDRFARAAAAYTVLRTRSGRGEALADLAGAGGPAVSSGAGMGDTARPGGTAGAGGTAPLPVLPPGRAWGRYSPITLASRIRRGRPGRLAIRVLIAVAVAGVAAAVAGRHPATPALVVGALTWLLLTARHDLAPPS